MATTAGTIIAAAMKHIQSLGIGETPSASEAADCLAALNLILDTWNADKAYIYKINVNAFSLITTQQVYTIGTGGNFNIARPVKVEAVKLALVDPGDNTGSLRLDIKLLSYREFAALNPRTLASTTPLMAYYDHGLPLASMYFWPTPKFSAATPQVELWTWAQLTAFPDLVTTITLPPGYERPLTYQLAVDIASIFSKPIAPEIMQIAAQSIAVIQALNKNVDNPYEPMPATPPQTLAQPGAPGAPQT